LALLAAAAAALASITLLNYLVVLTGVLLIVLFFSPLWRSQRAMAIKRALALPAITGVFLWAYLPYVIRLKDAGAFFYGGDRNFWDDTLHSLAASMLYDQSYMMALKLPLLLLFTAAAIAFLIRIFSILRSLAGREDIFPLALALVTGGCILSTIVQHRLLGTLYLMDRTALFFIPLFFLGMIVLATSPMRMAFPRYVIASLAVLAILHAGASFNLRYLLSWKEGAAVREAVSLLGKEKRTAEERVNLNIGIDFVFEPALNFYRVKDGLHWLNFVRTEPADSLNDFFLLYPHTKADPALFRAKLLAELDKGSARLYANGLRPVPRVVRTFYKDFESDEGANIHPASYGSGKRSCLTDTVFRYSAGCEYVIPDSLAGGHLMASFSARV